jgi:hypothetical protein
VSKIKSAREKKALSFKRDRRNTFGENSKASRKAIPRRKKLNHMGERRAVSQILRRLRESAEEEDATEADVLAKTTVVERKNKTFKKSPDSPLGGAVEKKLAERREQSRASQLDAAPFSLNFEADGVFDTPYPLDPNGVDTRKNLEDTGNINANLLRSGEMQSSGRLPFLKDFSHRSPKGARECCVIARKH